MQNTFVKKTCNIYKYHPHLKNGSLSWEITIKCFTCTLIDLFLRTKLNTLRHKCTSNLLKIQNTSITLMRCSVYITCNITIAPAAFLPT